jgi:hypothetical protein
MDSGRLLIKLHLHLLGASRECEALQTQAVAMWNKERARSTASRVMEPALCLKWVENEEPVELCLAAADGNSRLEEDL